MSTNPDLVLSDYNKNITHKNKCVMSWVVYLRQYLIALVVGTVLEQRCSSTVLHLLKYNYVQYSTQLARESFSAQAEQCIAHAVNESEAIIVAKHSIRVGQKVSAVLCLHWIIGSF